MEKFKLVLLTLFCMGSFCFATEEKEQVRPFLYSAEYFDYLIECANKEATVENEVKLELENEKKEDIALDDEITAFEFDETIKEEFEPFKLKVQQTSDVGIYGESYIKEDTKTIIPMGQKLSFIQDTYKFRNKYNSDDYRVLAGIEVKPFKILNVATGLETNYRGYDQNPTSRKLYLTPTLYLTDKLSLSFYNKLNVITHSSDHDIGLNLSPFKSKAVDFRVYAGITKNPDGKNSQSVNFYTNFYLF